ncbi:MAG: hypothetical protein MPL62_14880 [Alphaproteobacteria bacterium]|nr:hypothetical protein [Alphaproteobacteria bacterium]
MVRSWLQTTLRGKSAAAAFCACAPGAAASAVSSSAIFAARRRGSRLAGISGFFGWRGQSKNCVN